MMRHKFDASDCKERGDTGELIFTNLAQNRGWNIGYASPDENMYGHWDILISKGKEVYKVDVKGMKRISRYGDELYDWVWIELHGSMHDNKGWLFGGNADFIAFETDKSFLMLERARLAKFIPTLIIPGLAKDVSEAKYHIYNRRDYEQLMLVEIEKLRSIKAGEWEKPKSYYYSLETS